MNTPRRDVERRVEVVVGRCITNIIRLIEMTHDYTAEVIETRSRTSAPRLANAALACASSPCNRAAVCFHRSPSVVVINLRAPVDMRRTQAWLIFSS